MMRKAGLLVAATMLAAFAAAPNDSFAAAKKKTDQGSLKDPAQCTGGSCTAVNPDRVPSPQTSQYRSSRKKHHNK